LNILTIIIYVVESLVNFYRIYHYLQPCIVFCALPSRLCAYHAIYSW